MGWEYSYCTKCDLGLRKATPREVIEDVQFCAAGHPNTPNTTRDELLLELIERVEVIERLKDQ